MPDSTVEPIEKRLAVALEATREAGRVTLDWFQSTELSVELKADQSPVTAADVAAETLLRDRLLTAFPDDGFLGEETGSQQGSSGYEWVVDPIDGTKSFIRGVPLYATLVGCRRDGEGQLGVILIPALDELAYAAKGGGAWYQQGAASPVPAQVSATRQLRDSLICSSDFRDFRRRPPSLDAAAAGGQVRLDLENACGVVRTWGDAYGYLLVATGRAEVMADPMLNAWDAAAVAVVVTEAGGRFSDWTGCPTMDAGDGVASNGLVHEAVLAALSPAAVRQRG